MEPTYYISYSCYQRRMRILLNGKDSLSVSSDIRQFMNEPFYVWADKLLDLLYSEIEEDFNLVFVGRIEEIEIISFIAQIHPHCLRFESRIPVIHTPIQERMIELSKIIKENSLCCTQAINLNTIFWAKTSELSNYRFLVEELEIRNQYCNVEFSLKGYSDYKNICAEDIHFLLCDSIEESRQYLGEYNCSKYVFILLKNQPGRFIRLLGNAYCFGFEPETIFDMVFHCFFLFPLADCLAEYSGRLLREISNELLRTKIKVLLSEKSVIQISANERIELNCSVPFDVRVYPEKSRPPELMFEYQLPNIVECSQSRIYGKKEGRTKVLVFEKGEVEPIKELTFTVYKRNRVYAITLSDYALSLGVGDKCSISMQAFPFDADNLNEVQWYSDNEEIAVTDNSGNIYVKAAGKCNIYCAVEQVYESCAIESKPYLERIDVSEVFDSNSVRMTLGEEIDIDIKLTPCDAYDKQIRISSSNYMIANVRNGVVSAVGIGEADIYLENATKRISRKIHISVIDKKQKKKKSRMFSWLCME